MKKLVPLLALTLALLTPLPALGVQSGKPTRAITGFAPLSGGTVCRFSEEKPPLETVLRALPDTLDAVAGGEPVPLHVTWYCAGCDYDETEYYYYQFSPSWDTDAYPLAAGLDPLTDAPRMGVFLSDGGAVLMAVTNAACEPEIYQYLTEDMGLNTAAACGVMANLYAESAFRPDNLQNSYNRTLGFTDEAYTAAVDEGTYDNFVYDQAGYGLCQWTYWSRKEGLLNLARERGVSVADLTLQMDYLRQEMSGTVFRYLRSMPDSADGAYDAAYYFCVQFEKPSQAETMGVIRGNLARDQYWPEYGTEEPLPDDTDTFIRASREEGTVTVTASGAAVGTVMCAVYDEDGRFLACDLLELSDGEDRYVFDFGELSFSDVEAFLLDGEYAPLCADRRGKPVGEE